MRLLDLPIRLLLAAIFAVALPLLCCCGAASAQEPAVVEAHPATPAPRADDPHVCCETTGSESAKSATHHQPNPSQPLPDHHDSGDCDCDTHVRAMQDVKTDLHQPVPAPANGACFVLAPLPLPLSAVLVDAVDVVPPPAASEAAALPAAPSLRTLSILLLT